MINHEETGGIFYMDLKGKVSEINYN